MFANTVRTRNGNRGLFKAHSIPMYMPDYIFVYYKVVDKYSTKDIGFLWSYKMLCLSLIVENIAM